MTHHTLHLTQKDSKAVSDVLGDLSRHVPCGFAVGGSLAQRAFIPTFASLYAGKTLADIDVVLLGESFEMCPISPSVSDDFFVLDIRPMNRGYNFGMIHKRTGMWVDIFSAPYAYPSHNTIVNGVPYDAISIESQILYLSHDLFLRIRDGLPVRKKWREKLMYLYEQYAHNKEELYTEYEEHREYYSRVYPATMTAPSDADTYIRASIEYSKQHTELGYRDKILFFLQYPQGATVTSNGIAVESYPNFIRALFRMWKRTG